jgi:hypothetical protein
VEAVKNGVRKSVRKIVKNGVRKIKDDYQECYREDCHEGFLRMCQECCSERCQERYFRKDARTGSRVRINDFIRTDIGIVVNMCKLFQNYQLGN